MDWLESTKVSFRLFLSTLVAGLALLALSAYSLYTLHSIMLEDRQTKARHLVESVHSLIAYYHDQETSGRLDRAAAKQAAIAAIKAMRYGTDDYFWIHDMNLKMVMHPMKPALDGTDLTNNQDPNGFRLFAEMNRVVGDRGAGIVSYMWAKPNHDTPQPKVSYVMGFQPWGWVVGSGIYIDDIQDAFWQNALSLLVILALAMVVLVSLSWAIARGILGQLGGEPAYAKAVVGRIASGDLSRPIADAPQGSVVHAMAEMQARLANLMQQVHRTAEAVAQEARTIVGSSGQVDAAADTQVNATSAVAAEVEELAASIAEVADMAHQTETNSMEVEKQAHEGDPLARETSHCIEGISDTVASSVDQILALRNRSLEIGRIAQVIDEIAAQTNLLALNAAIEAARAGDMGRGFSVVADEVRNLAERTSQATQEISAMVAGVQADTEKVVESMSRAEPQVREGHSYAHRLSESLVLINSHASDSLGMARVVASASKEQASAVNDIAAQIERITSMAEQTHVAVRGNAEEARHLGDIADDLRSAVSQFRIN